MKVMIVNGSSHENGTTMVAINEMIKVFDEEGVETEVIQLGSKPSPYPTVFSATTASKTADACSMTR